MNTTEPNAVAGQRKRQMSKAPAGHAGASAVPTFGPDPAHEGQRFWTSLVDRKGDLKAVNQRNEHLIPDGTTLAGCILKSDVAIDPGHFAARPASAANPFCLRFNRPLDCITRGAGGRSRG
jgi:hypothetical protein